MDLEHADPGADAGADQRSRSRRSMIGLAGVAGLAGAAMTLLAEQTAGAAAGDQPGQPTDEDVALMAAALRLEQTARDLYRSQLDSDPDGDLAVAVGVMADNHRAYAEAIAGFTGLSAGAVGRDDDIYDSLADAFASNDFAAAAHSLEQTAVATHTSLLAEYESAQAIGLTTSILVVEARHATVLADVLGVDDFDVLFGNDQSALALGGA